MKKLILAMTFCVLSFAASDVAVACHGPYTANGVPQVFTDPETGGLTVLCVITPPGQTGSQCNPGEKTIVESPVFHGATCTVEYRCCLDPIGAGQRSFGSHSVCEPAQGSSSTLDLSLEDESKTGAKASNPHTIVFDPGLDPSVQLQYCPGR